MDSEEVLNKLRMIRDAMDDEPDEAVHEMDCLIEELESEAKE